MLVRETVEVLLWLLTQLKITGCLSSEWSVGDLAVLERMLWESMLKSPTFILG